MTSSSSQAGTKDWLAGARPHTWANAFAPVIAGTAAALYRDEARALPAFLALIVAWALVIGVNYANDYSDGIRGTDSNQRTGPTRLTGSGLARPAKVKKAAFISFGVAIIAGILLALMSSWWLILVGALCIAAAWFYTGGSHPYGYYGLGEVAIFIFFGLVAVLGTEFTQAGSVTGLGVALAVSIGAFSSAVNLANNIRDIPSDTEAGKRTLAVLLGNKASRRLFSALIIAPYLITLIIGLIVFPAVLMAFLSMLWSLQALYLVNSGTRGTKLVPVLGLTGRAMAVWSLLVFIAFVLA